MARHPPPQSPGQIQGFSAPACLPSLSFPISPRQPLLEEALERIFRHKDEARQPVSSSCSCRLGAQPQWAPKWRQFPLSLDRDHSHPPSSWELPQNLRHQVASAPHLPTLPPNPQIRGLEPEAMPSVYRLRRGERGWQVLKAH